MYNKLYGMMNWPLIEGIEYTDITNPHDILGPHMTSDGLLVQAFIPDADSATLTYKNKTVDMYRMDENGFFATLLDEKKAVGYTIKANYGEVSHEFVDAYSFEVGEEYDSYKKLNAGILYNAYDIMGAHPQKIEGVEGVRFRVWAPFAMRVSVIGEFNNWDGRKNQMTMIDDTGVFEIFVPGAKAGQLYKYEIKKKGYENVFKADPYAFLTENKEEPACYISDLDSYKWKDSEWVKNRKKYEVETSPLNIYEMNIATFKKNDNGGVNYREVASDVAKYVKDMGYTHVELMPVTAYANDDSLGYEPVCFYALTSRYGTPEDFMYFVDEMHANDIGVIIDFPINQFASDEQGLRAFDGSNLYEHMDPAKGINPRNGAYMFNYARPEVTSYLIGSAFMWINKYHIDGLKMVSVASMIYLDYDRKPMEWIPNIYGGNENLEAIEFIKHFNSIIHKSAEGVFVIADDNSGYPQLTGEVSEDCLGFDLKINEEWKKSVIDFMAVPAYLRKNSYNDLALSMVYQYSDNFVVGYQNDLFIRGNAPLIARMTGDTEERKFANMRLALSYMMVHPGKKSLFMGQDMAQYNQWTAQGALDMGILNVDKHSGIQKCVKALNKMYKSEPALYQLDSDTDGFEWINNISANECIYTFARKGTNYGKSAADEDMLIVVCNFDAVDHEEYKIGVPKKGKYKEIFNSDSKEFGGNGFVNSRLKQSKEDECDGREESIRINVPALGVVVLKYSKVDEKPAGNKAAKENVAKKTTKSTTKSATKTAEKKTTKTTVPNIEDVKEEKKASLKTETVKEIPADKKTEAKSKKKAEPKAEVKEEKKAEPKSEAKEEKKAEPKAEAKEEKKAEAKAEAKEDKKAEPKTEVKEDKKAKK